MVGVFEAAALNCTIPFTLELAFTKLITGAGRLIFTVRVCVSICPSLLVTVSVIGYVPVLGKVNVGKAVPAFAPPTCVAEVAPGADHAKVAALDESLPSQVAPEPETLQVKSATGGAVRTTIRRVS